MAYFLGRDVKVAITLESANKQIDYGSGAITVANETTTPQAMFSRDLAGETLFGGSTVNSSVAGAKTHPVQDLTGVDVSLGAVDEDIAYMGQRTALKAEIKKESTITLTKKKDSNFFSLLFNKARYGVKTDATNGANGFILSTDGQPGIDFGYRVHVMLNSSGEVLSFKNCTLSEYNTTLNADGVTEETMTFMSHVLPVNTNAVAADNVAATDTDL